MRWQRAEASAHGDGLHPMRRAFKRHRAQSLSRRPLRSTGGSEVSRAQDPKSIRAFARIPQTLFRSLEAEDANTIPFASSEPARPVQADIGMRQGF